MARSRRPKRGRIGMAAAAIIAMATCLASCEEDVSPIGGGLRPVDVSITVDSTTFDLKGRSVEALSIDSRSTNTLLGSISAPGYGSLRCSYVTQLMPAENVNIPDSIKPENIDSVKLILRMPVASITGDTLAPQQATVYRLTSQLPADISSTYDPDGKFDNTPMGRRNYTLSSLAMGNTANVAMMSKVKTLSLQVPMPRRFGVDALAQYRENPAIFQWPQKFAEEFPGLFVDATFGKGCIASISASGIYVFTHHTVTKVETVDDKTVSKLVDVRDSLCFFSSAPEVISSNIIDYKPSAELREMVKKGDVVLTTPGGYSARFTFPADEVLGEFRKHNSDLAVINQLSMSIPAEKIANELNVDVPPTLLMVKTSEAESFFRESKVPDFKSSFICTWNATTGTYRFGSMRQYINDLNDLPEGPKPEDTDFMLIPVNTVSESVNNSDGSTSTVYTSCVPYLSKPTMVRLHTDRAVIVFTFSNQVLN